MKKTKDETEKIKIAASIKMLENQVDQIAKKEIDATIKQ